MTAFVIDAEMDAALTYLKTNITEMRVTSGTPTTRAQAVTNTLAAKTGLTSGDFSALANGDVSGRKVGKTAETGISITASGTANTVSFCDATDLIWRVDLSATQVLTSGGTVDTSLVEHEILDAA